MQTGGEFCSPIWEALATFIWDHASRRVYQDAYGKIFSMDPAAKRILDETPAEFLSSSSVGEEHDTIREDG